MAIDPKLVQIVPVDELESVTGLQDGELLFYDTTTPKNKLKKISIDTFNNLSKTAKPLAPTDPTPTAEGVYKPTISGTYTNAGGLVAQAGYDTLFFFNGTTWTKSEFAYPAATQSIVPFSTSTFPLVAPIPPNAPIQRTHNDVIWELKQGQTSQNTDIPNEDSLVWKKIGVSKTDIFKNNGELYNLYNKLYFRLNTAFNTTNGNIIASNSSNGISELIKIEQKDYILRTYNGKNIAGFIVEYDSNYNYIGYKSIGVVRSKIYKPENNVGYVRINLNTAPSVSLVEMNDSLTIYASEKLQPKYLNFKEQPIITNSSELFMKEDTTVDLAGGMGTYDSATKIFTIPSGSHSLSGYYIARKLISKAGRNLYKYRVDFNDSLFLSFVEFSKAVFVEGTGYVPKHTVSRVDNSIIFNVDDVFTAGQTISFNLTLNGAYVYDFGTDVTIKTSIKSVNLKSDGMPNVDFGNVNDAQVVELINDTIGDNLNDYFVDNINDFTFNQPNYIQANSSFDLMSITSSYSNKFLSIIQDIDLGGATLDLEAKNIKGLKLVFNGGRILNGKVKPNQTTCIFNSLQAFKNVEILGRFENETARPENFGAELDGVDGGIGNFTKDDSFAFNQAFKAVNTVFCVGKKTAIIKRSLILQGVNSLIMDADFTLKLGDAANCTLLKNRAIDFPNTGLVNGVTYPSNYTRDKFIKIKGGIIEGNALKQFRQGSAGQSYGGNPEVDNTPVFRDGDGHQYIGIMCKFADIDDLIIEDVTFKDSRTYHLAFGGITNFKGLNNRSLRSVHLTNQDGFHAHGLCNNIEIDGLVGHSGDDLFAITTMEAGTLSLRVGDIGKVSVKNIIETGIHPSATIQNPILAPLYNDYPSFGPLRFSVTNETIEEVLVENITYNQPYKGCAIIISNIPNANITTPNPYGYGTGKVKRVLIKNVVGRINSVYPVGLGQFTTIDYIKISDLTHNLITNSSNTAIIADKENFTPGMVDPYINNLISVLEIDSVNIIKGQSHPGLRGFIDVAGEIREVIFNKITMSELPNSPNSHQLFAKGNIKSMSISNSTIRVKKMFEMTNADFVLKESNNTYIYHDNTSYIQPVMGTVPSRANTSNLVMPSNPISPIIGDKILKSDGFYVYIGGAFAKMN